jgi:hypothetical protein
VSAGGEHNFRRITVQDQTTKLEGLSIPPPLSIPIHEQSNTNEPDFKRSDLDSNNHVGDPLSPTSFEDAKNRLTLDAESKEFIIPQNRPIDEPVNP